MYKIVKVLPILFLIHVPLKLISQEYSIFTNYYLSPFIINPAATGLEYYPSAEVSVKRQWLGIANAPTTYFLSSNYRIGSYDFYDPKGFVNKGPLKLKDRIGLGAALYSDKDGPLVNSGGLISYAYHLPVNSKSRLSFGMSVLMNYYSFNGSILEPEDADDSYLYSDTKSTFKTNINFGVSFYNNDYFVGISSTKLLKDIKYVTDDVKFQPSYYLTGGYKFKPVDIFVIEPSATVKVVENKLYTDFYTKVYVNANWVALSYSSEKKINFLFGIHLVKMAYAGYNFEYTTSKIATYNNGTHEIFLGINLGLRGSVSVKNRSNNN